MKFFGRGEEIAELQHIKEMSLERAQFTVLTGRRRVGKTELVKKAFESEKYLYFYVSKKSQAELCEEYRLIIEQVLGMAVPGRIERFEDVFRLVLDRARTTPLTVFIDEFQEFLKIDESVFSAMAKLWDEYHAQSKINLIVCGSINRLMGRIFENDEAPLYGRNTSKFQLDPFGIPVLKEILEAYKPDFTSEDMLALWTFTGGVARPVSLLMDEGAFSMEQMVDRMIRIGSTFVGEGKALLVEEFGKEYANYFTVLSSIANGRTRRTEIEQMLGGSAGGYITKLEDDYALIAKRQPIFEKAVNKNCVYALNDNFLKFWFRFVWKYSYLLELKYYDELRDLIKRDYKAFSGFALESYFRSRFASEHAYTRMGGWWDRKGENEIDLVCENEFKGTLDFFEIKRDAERFDRRLLEAKVERFFEKNPDKRKLKFSLGGLSMSDMI